MKRIKFLVLTACVILKQIFLAQGMRIGWVQPATTTTTAPVSSNNYNNNIPGKYFTIKPLHQDLSSKNTCLG